jgi:hypothetical protein
MNPKAERASIPEKSQEITLGVGDLYLMKHFSYVRLNRNRP